MKCVNCNERPVYVKKCKLCSVCYNRERTRRKRAYTVKDPYPAMSIMDISKEMNIGYETVRCALKSGMNKLRNNIECLAIAREYFDEAYKTNDLSHVKTWDRNTIDHCFYDICE